MVLASIYFIIYDTNNACQLTFVCVLCRKQDPYGKLFETKTRKDKRKYGKNE